MGKVIISMVLILEVFFTTYCIKTKDSQNKVRSLIRISGFILFVLAALSPIIDWGFRWYFFAVSLFVVATIATVRMFTKKFDKKTYKKSRVIFKGAAMFLVFYFAIIPAIIFPQYKNPEITGNHKIETSSYTFTDENRIEEFTDTGENRKVTVEFWYPKEAEGKYPLIIFSHGAFGVKMSNTSTFMELASNGYVVCSIDHPYHAAGTMDVDGKLTIGSSEFVQEIIDVNKDIYSEKDQFELFNKWMGLRTEDIDFVINTILKNTENKKAGLYERIDTKKIGLIGHSLGGAASVEIGRKRNDIDAVINLDGTMLGEYKINKNGVIVINEEPYALPLLNFYSEDIIDELEADAEYIYPNEYISSISSVAFEFCVKGSNHMSYTDLPLFSPFLAEQLSGISGGSTKVKVDAHDCIEKMNRIVLGFFNCYLKEEGTGRERFVELLYN